MKYAIISSLILLSACNSGMSNIGNVVNTTIADGQLFCAAKSAVVVMADLSGAPILAKDASSTFVTDVCGLIDGVPVSPPNDSTGIPTETVDASIVTPVAK